MANIEAMIKWMKDREGKVTYSMSNRYGPNSFDCSSAVYYSLIAGGFLPSGTMGNTDSLFNHLEQNKWVKVPLTNGSYATKRGDVFIWGARGASGGAAGHTGIFVDSANIIHCNYGSNGITTNNHNTSWSYSGSPAVTVYRYAGAPPFPSRACKVKVGNIVRLSGGAKVASPWSSNEKIPSNMVNKYYRVERIEKLNAKWESSEYQVLIHSDESNYRKWIYEQDLSIAPAAKFKKGLKVRLSTGATNASRYWSRRVLEKKFLGQEYTIGDVVTTAESYSPYQYLISSSSLGNLWVLEQDLADRTIRFITNEPFMNQEHNQNAEVKNKNLYKTIINDISTEATAKLMAEFTRKKTWPMLTNGNVFLIEYPTHLMVKVVGVKLDSTASVKSECLRLTKGQIPSYNERDMKVVLQTNKKYNWIEIDNLPKDWQAISNRLRHNLRELFCQYFLATRVSYGQQSDGKFYFQIINIENKERATELATKLKGWFPGDTNEYTNAQVFLQN